MDRKSKRQQDLEAFSRGARGENRFKGLKSIFGFNGEETKQPTVDEESIRDQKIINSLEGPSGPRTRDLMSKTVGDNPQQQIRDSQNSILNSRQPEFNPSFEEMESFANENYLRPSLSESDDQFMKRLKVLMQERR